jgi:hypothetical protein
MMLLLPFSNRNSGRNRCWAWPGLDGARLKERLLQKNTLIFPPKSVNRRIWRDFVHHAARRRAPNGIWRWRAGHGRLAAG